MNWMLSVAAGLFLAVGFVGAGSASAQNAAAALAGYADPRCAKPCAWDTYKWRCVCRQCAKNVPKRLPKGRTVCVRDKRSGRCVCRPPCPPRWYYNPGLARCYPKCPDGSRWNFTLNQCRP